MHCYARYDGNIPMILEEGLQAPGQQEPGTPAHAWKSSTQEASAERL